MKRLYRDRFDKLLGGVCGGLGQYFQIDSSVIRLIYVALTCLSFGISILLYAILWLLLPLGPRAYVVASYKKLYRSKRDRKIAGVLGGLAKYLKIDSTLLRIFFIILLFLTGILPLVIFYIAASSIVPEEF